MTAPIVSAAASKLESRFVLNALVPTLVFGPISAAIILHSTFGLDRLADRYAHLPAPLIVLVPLGVVAASWLIASLIASQFDRIVTIFEGYPLVGLHSWMSAHRATRPLADALGIPGVSAHVRRRNRFVADVERARRRPNEVSDAYTDREDLLLPTRLGNILRSAELYPFERYGIDFTILWTRLALLVPSHVLADIERTIIQYQLPLVISGWLAVVSLCALALACTGSAAAFFVVFGLASIGSIASYTWALRSAQHYGSLVRSVFDLYREDLRSKWPAILSADLERIDFERLQRFIATGRVVLADGRSSGPDDDADNDVHARHRDVATAAAEVVARPALVPSLRLRTFALCGIGAVMFIGACYLRLHRVDVAVVTAAADPFETVLIERGTRPLFQVGRRNAAPASLATKTIVVTRAVRSGEVLAPGDYIAVDGTLSLGAVASVRDTAGVDRRLGLHTGDQVVLLVGGKAGFEADARCAGPSGPGERRVTGVVLAPPDRLGNILLGIGDTELAAVAQCFDLDKARIVRRLP